MRRLFRLALLTLAMSATALPVLAQSAPTMLDTDSVTGLYQKLTALPEGSLSPHQIRELALLVFLKANKVKRSDKAALKADAVHLDQLVELSGNDPEVMAVRANLYGVEARDAGSDIEALVLSKKGIRLLDKLALEYPDNGGVLMQRGLNALHTPSFVGRDRYITHDFNELLSKKFDLASDPRAYVLYNLALGYKKLGDIAKAKATRQQAVELNIAPWSELAAKIQLD